MARIVKAVIRVAHRDFCENEGWVQVKRPAGGTVNHHLTFTLPLADGRILRTRISRPIRPEAYSKSMAAHILRNQLCVSPDEFWLCADDGVAPNRAPVTPSVEAIPAAIINVLARDLRMPESEIARLTRAEAIGLANQYWSKGTMALCQWPSECLEPAPGQYVS